MIREGLIHMASARLKPTQCIVLSRQKHIIACRLYRGSYSYWPLQDKTNTMNCALHVAAIHWRSAITHYMHVRDKNSKTQGISANVVKVFFHTLRNCSSRKEFAPSGSKLFSLREVPILKRDYCRESVLETKVSH